MEVQQKFSVESMDRMNDKCDEIIDSLSKFTVAEKYRVVKVLHDSFLEACRKDGIVIEEVTE